MIVYKSLSYFVQVMKCYDCHMRAKTAKRHLYSTVYCTIYLWTLRVIPVNFSNVIFLTFRTYIRSKFCLGWVSFLDFLPYSGPDHLDPGSLGWGNMFFVRREQSSDILPFYLVPLLFIQRKQFITRSKGVFTKEKPVELCLWLHSCCKIFLFG